MTLEAANKSAVVRPVVPRIDIRALLQDSEPAVKEGIWAASLLHLWVRRAGMS